MVKSLCGYGACAVRARCMRSVGMAHVLLGPGACAVRSWRMRSVGMAHVLAAWGAVALLNGGCMALTNTTQCTVWLCGMCDCVAAWHKLGVTAVANGKICDNAQKQICDGALLCTCCVPCSVPLCCPLLRMVRHGRVAANP
eukprot:156346-Chlamydomonas_euryale.AAC.5